MRMRSLLTAVGSIAILGACSGGGGGGGATFCADGGACPAGQVCGPQGFCVVGGGTGGSSGAGGSGGGVGGTGGGVGGVGGGVGGSGGGVGGSGGGVGGSGGGVGGSGGGVGGSGGGVGGSGGGFGGSGGVGGAGGSGGSGTFDCAGYCAKWDGANCPNDPTLSACISTCQSETAAAAGASCGSQATGWLECVKNTATITCDTAGESVTSDCAPQNQAYIACAICVLPTTDPCGQCNQQSCCTPMKTFWSDANSSAFVGCVQPCTTQTCYDQCVTQFSTAASKYNAWVQCQTSSCGSACG